MDTFADWSKENELFGGTPKNPFVTTSRPDYNPRPDRRVPESCCDSGSNQVKNSLVKLFFFFDKVDKKDKQNVGTFHSCLFYAIYTVLSF